MTSSIFHYTDVAGLLGILSSESLYATDYRYLNDSTEAGSIRDLLLPLFQSEVAAIMPALVKKGVLGREYFDQHGQEISRLEANGLYRAFSHTMNNVSPLFVVSFCRHDENSAEFENGLLSQWRGYSRVGGFAIEFDESKFGEALEAEYKSFTYAVLKSDDVSYGDHKKLFDEETYRGVAGEMIRGVFENKKIDVSEITGRKNLDEAFFYQNGALS